MPPVKIIQGGMGVAVSGWQLARAVSQLGQLGVVSGTGLAVVLARRLQAGDPGGHMRRALAQFPLPDVAQRVADRYFIEGGKPPHQPFRAMPLPTLPLTDELTELTVIANFVEVHLAKEAHAGVVGINYLEKIQLPTLASLLGAMLAGVDVVLVGAGIPRFIPGALDAFAAGKVAELPIYVDGAAADETVVSRLDPVAFCGGRLPRLRRPQFLAIVSSATLAATLARKSSGRVDGFVVEGVSAGGHNAPPRGPAQRNERGEPVYGPRDAVDLDKIRELGLPFWLAGGYGYPDKLKAALQLGAAGVQVGTAFAFCEESGIEPNLKSRIIRKAVKGEVLVHTDPDASPTRFPFKVLQLEGTLSEQRVFEERPRICDIGYLRQAYRRADGTVGHRCGAEPVEAFVFKGGAAGDTEGKKCICNALFSTIGLGQVMATDGVEPPIVTAGDFIGDLPQFLAPGRMSYSAADVVRYLLPGRD